MRVLFAALLFAALLFAQKPQLRVQTGHSQDVETGVLSHNGKYVLSISTDGLTILWDAATATEIRRFDGGLPGIRTACFTADDRAILAGGVRQAWVWDLATGRPLMVFDKHQETGTVAVTPDGRMLLTADQNVTRFFDATTGKEVRSIRGASPTAISPDGLTLATGVPGLADSKDGSILLWSIDGRELGRLQGHTDSLRALGFSADGKALVSASRDDTTRLWDTASHRELWRHAGDNNYDAAVSADNRLVAVSAKGGACLLGIADGKLQRCLQGNSHYVNTLSFSADGKQLLTPVSDPANQDNRLVLWDVASGREIRRFEGLGAGIWSAVFAPDGRYIGTAGADGSAHVWDLWRGSEAHRLEPRGHANQVFAVVWSPDGKYLASASRDATARLWDAVTGQEIRRFAHGDDVVSVAFSPDGRLLATGSQDDTARVWDVTSGRELWRTSTLTGDVWGVSFSPDGRTLATGSDDHTYRLWDVATGSQKLRIDTGAAPAGPLAFSPDGRTLAGSVGNSVVQWETATGKETRKLEMTSAASVASIAFSPDGRLIAANSIDRKSRASEQRLWNAATGAWIRTLAAPARAFFTSVSFSADSRTLVTAVAGQNGQNNFAVLSDAATGREIRQFRGHLAEVYGARLSPDGKTLATASADREIRLWNVAGGDQILRIECHGHSGSVSAIAFTPDGQSVLTGGNDVRLWDLDDGDESRVMHLEPNGEPLPMYFSVSSLAFAPDGKSAVAGLSTLSGEYNMAAVWDVSTGKTTRVLGGKQAQHGSVSLGVRSAALSPDGALVAMASDDHSARLFHFSGGTEVRSYTGPAKSVSFSKDGRLLVAGSDGIARILDVATFREIRSFNPNTGDLATAVFSPDGKTVAMAGWGRIISLFNAADGSLLRKLDGHLDSVWSLQFSADGRLLLSASADGTTRLWNVADGRELCQMISLPGGVWVVVDPEGRFDTNRPDQIRGLKWVAPDAPLRPLPVEIFLREFYEPQLLARIVAGKPFKPVRPITAIDRVQPQVRIVSVQPAAPGTVDISLQLSGAAASDLRLFRDGQMVRYQPGRNQPGRVTLAGVQIPSGAAGTVVTFSAYAFNDDKIKSETASLSYRYATALAPRARRAYIVSMGVNYNEMPALRLTTGVNDARRTSESMAAGLRKTGEYAEVVTVQLLSDERVRTATRANFQAVLNVLAGHAVAPALLASIPNAAKLRKVSPDDLVILSASSHGYRNAQQVFYLVPYVTVKDESRMDDVWAQSISSDDLELWLRDVDAGEMVLLIDACYAGAAIQARGFVPGPMGSRGLGQLAYDKGMRVLTATQASNVAIESETLGYSLLTYATIVEGLDEHKAVSKAGNITTSKLLEYAEARVPKLFADVIAGKVTTRGPVANAEPGVQQPQLFDFVRNGREAKLAVGLVAPVQRGIRDDFADRITGMDSGIAQALRQFVTQMKEFQEGRPGDRVALHQSYDRAVGLVTDALSMSTSMKVPQTPDCLELMAGFRELLSAMQSKILPELKNAVEKVDAANGKLDLLGKLEVIGALNRAGKADEAARARFLTAAKEFDRQDRSIR